MNAVQGALVAQAFILGVPALFVGGISVAVFAVEQSRGSLIGLLIGAALAIATVVSGIAAAWAGVA